MVIHVCMFVSFEQPQPRAAAGDVQRRVHHGQDRPCADPVHPIGDRLRNRARRPVRGQSGQRQHDQVRPAPTRQPHTPDAAHDCSWWIWIAIAYTFGLAMHGYYALVALPTRLRALRAPDPAPVAAAYVPPTASAGYVQPQYYAGQPYAQPQYAQPGAAVTAPYAAPYPPSGTTGAWQAGSGGVWVVSCGWRRTLTLTSPLPTRHGLLRSPGEQAGVRTDVA